METGKINALMMEETDNVVTCVMEIKKETPSFTAREIHTVPWRRWRTFPTATRSP